ncbi:MAG TPA: anti-sigma factor [Pirellulaceae bacterium]|nr:anti-sigma factor [Pirellulaceae bacterium]HMO91235.1 anti-sigma factor [Pirellulaceae bacterium]HMP68581.1 anti-sigma factor [Pirellulaceae bacterium]
MNSSKNDRLLELLVDQATMGLSDAEKVELGSLLNALGLDDDWSFDQVAAIIDLGVAEEEMNPLPSHIRNKVVDQARDYLAVEKSSQRHAAQIEDRRPLSNIVEQQPTKSERTAPAVSNRELLAWLATAACLLLAAFAWFSRANGPSGRTPVVESATPLIKQVGELDFDEFLQRSNLMRVDLAPGPDQSAVAATATVYWDPQKKLGFIKIAGLRPNEASAEQYQLWIIDRVRGIEDRPNAGVFDISEAGEVIFRFRSDLEIFDAQGFAVTVEKPGGINKSDLSRIALINLGG